jgi:hypothetical protein
MTVWGGSYKSNFTTTSKMGISTAGWPDEFVKKVAQNITQPMSCQNTYIICTVEKIGPKFLCYKKLPK